MRDILNFDWRTFLPEIEIPTLVFVVDQMPNAETVFFDDAGHMLFWEKSE